MHVNPSGIIGVGTVELWVCARETGKKQNSRETLMKRALTWKSRISCARSESECSSNRQAAGPSPVNPSQISPFRDWAFRIQPIIRTKYHIKHLACSHISKGFYTIAINFHETSKANRKLPPVNIRTRLLGWQTAKHYFKWFNV